jgi:hypothetical protein
MPRSLPSVSKKTFIHFHTSFVIAFFISLAIGCGGSPYDLSAESTAPWGDPKTENLFHDVAEKLNDLAIAVDSKNASKVDQSLSSTKSYLDSLRGLPVTLKREIREIRQNILEVYSFPLESSWKSTDIERFELEIRVYPEGPLLQDEKSVVEQKAWAKHYQAAYYGSVDNAIKQLGTLNYIESYAPSNFLTVGGSVNRAAAQNLSSGDEIVLQGRVSHYELEVREDFRLPDAPYLILHVVDCSSL